MIRDAQSTDEKEASSLTQMALRHRLASLSFADIEHRPADIWSLNSSYDPPLSAVSTWPNRAFALLPIEVIVPIHTTMIRAIITAYSTAVGPSSETKNFFTLLSNFIATPFKREALLRGRLVLSPSR